MFMTTAGWLADMGVSEKALALQLARCTDLTPVQT